VLPMDDDASLGLTRSEAELRDRTFETPEPIEDWFRPEAREYETPAGPGVGPRRRGAAEDGCRLTGTHRRDRFATPDC
jgi:Predicted nuclease of the RecB family